MAQVNGEAKRTGRIRRWIGRIRRGRRDVEVVDLLAYRSRKEVERMVNQKEKKHG